MYVNMYILISKVIKTIPRNVYSLYRWERAAVLAQKKRTERKRRTKAAGRGGSMADLEALPDALLAGAAIAAALAMAPPDAAQSLLEKLEHAFDAAELAVWRRASRWQISRVVP